MGEAPQARFVLKQGTRIDERELREFAGEPRALQGVPQCTFVKELRKTATGKTQKYVLEAQRPAIASQ
jgi:acyl-coenzyme A synthetase/AMP-(fatty) acid ligase